MSSSILRGLNSTIIPLGANDVFRGDPEFAGSLLTVLVNCYADTEIKVEIFEYIKQSFTVSVPISTTIVPALTNQQIQVNISFPYVFLVVTNMSAMAQTQLNINTVYTNLLPLGAGILDASGNIVISGSVAVTSVAGVVDISGNVISTPAMSSAQLRYTPLVVGHWYQVASVGDTPGAVWAEMGAIVGGESVPPVGRQFQCLYAGYGTGTCYDITAPVDTTGVASVTVVGNVDVTCQNLPIVNNGHDCVAVSVDSWQVGTIPVVLDTSGNTIKIDPANNGVSFNDASTVTVSSITNPLPVGTNILGFVGLDATNGNNTIAISQNGTANGVQVVSALPAGTEVIGKVGLDTGGNTIGVVGIDTSLNYVKIDPSYNVVSGSVSITNSFKLNSFTYASVGAGWVSDSADLRVYSLADIYMLSAGSVSSTLGMNFIGQYSPDNTNWFNSGNTLTLTTLAPQGIAVGILTASPYIRLIADPANAAEDVATDVSLWIPTKSI